MSGHPETRYSGPEIGELISELTAIRSEIIAEAASPNRLLDAVHANFRESAHNLLHYLALRRHDLRPLQLRLAALGLSSLGRSEAHVLATLDAVLEILHRLTERPWQPSPKEEGIDFATGEHLLAKHTQELFGPAPSGREVRIMVTMPSEAASDYGFVHALLKQGMDCMRINCAYDNAATWLRMIKHLRQAERALGRPCRVVMDLAGPKLRTGPLEPGPAVARICPRYDSYGRVIAPARVWLISAARPSAPSSPADASLSVSEEWLSRLRQGDPVEFKDTRGRKERLVIVEITHAGCWAEATETAYIVAGTTLRIARDNSGIEGEGMVGDILPAKNANAILLYEGDRLILTRDLKPGRPAVHDETGRLVTDATIGCTIPEVFDDVRPGEAIWFDDGKIGGVIENVENTRVVVRITQAGLRGRKLRGGKGINLPESKLRLSALTAKDFEDLSFLAQNADIIELSFANRMEDIELLQEQLARLGSRLPAVVLKIETRRAFENLPDLLLTTMRSPCCGVMIARGDLAIECGFERLAEVQEEILWICEAAHVPVIWATQVLETLAKKGTPSRAEITDAAMGDRAECVMLNKGPHVLAAARALDDILRRMQAHQAKKRAMLRKLHLAYREVIPNT